MTILFVVCPLLLSLYISTISPNIWRNSMLKFPNYMWYIIIPCGIALSLFVFVGLSMPSMATRIGPYAVLFSSIIFGYVMSYFINSCNQQKTMKNIVSWVFIILIVVIGFMNVTSPILAIDNPLWLKNTYTSAGVVTISEMNGADKCVNIVPASQEILTVNWLSRSLSFLSYQDRYRSQSTPPSLIDTRISSISNWIYINDLSGKFIIYPNRLQSMLTRNYQNGDEHSKYELIQLDSEYSQRLSFSSQKYYTNNHVDLLYCFRSGEVTL